MAVDQGFFLKPPWSVMRRFVNNLPNVDFPDDFGPHKKTMGVDFLLAATRSASFLYHCAGENRSCKNALLGRSSGVNIILKVGSVLSGLVVS